jgi:hypothetical protein
MVSSSPDRYTFQAEGYVKRCEEKGEEPNEDYLNLFKSYRERDDENMADPEWQKCNLEYDLRSTDWILDKVRQSDSYAQNLYAALCNMQWRSKQFWPALAEQNWSCSWRSAGGIVANMLQKGDYIDWYCSGMGGLSGYDKDSETYEEWKERTKYVPEGHITEEIENDLDRLGWVPIPFED